MGIKRTIKKVAKTALRTQARVGRAGMGMANTFIPGVGTVAKPIFDKYDKLGAADKKKVHKAKSKTAKMKLIKKKK